MSSSIGSFDAVGIVIDWLDACRQGRLADLLELYSDQASLDCCDGGHFVGPTGLLRYWSAKLGTATESAFELEELMPEGDCVRLDYRDYDGSAVRTKFWFDDLGNITRTRCVPLERASPHARVV
ncbi:nuclear transport factor 2 family protein [Bradyrhizobium genosp. A]|uniref:nuclear transport factor 2 family protein n=1 Tax=Bradyrhizobium genosp. A TaxID=83626 RepID=UPI003CEE7106